MGYHLASTILIFERGDFFVGIWGEGGEEGFSVLVDHGFEVFTVVREHWGGDLNNK